MTKVVLANLAVDQVVVRESVDLEGWKKTIEAAKKGSVLSMADRFGTPEVGVDPKALPAVLEALRDGKDTALDMLVDLVGVDYSEYPGWTGPRFGLLYHLKSVALGHRLTLRVLPPGEDPEAPTVSHLYRNADWLEREAWDQYGIRFRGHPNLKRLLNHREFVGHPLRKDYPITRRQALSAPDPLTDEMKARLAGKGWT